MLEPAGLLCTDGKRLTLIPWGKSKPLTWEITVACYTAESYIWDSVSRPGGAAERLPFVKQLNRQLTAYMFQPIALKTLGVFNE